MRGFLRCSRRLALGLNGEVHGWLYGLRVVQWSGLRRRHDAGPGPPARAGIADPVLLIRQDQ